MTNDRQSRIQAFAFVVAISVCILICLFFAWSFLHFDSAFEQEEIRSVEKINPNEAPIASLVRLPGIGTARAEAIVEYRERFGRQERSGWAFRDCNDLKKVKGIGAKTVKDMCEWLRFE